MAFKVTKVQGQRLAELQSRAGFKHRARRTKHRALPGGRFQEITLADSYVKCSLFTADADGKMVTPDHPWIEATGDTEESALYAVLLKAKGTPNPQISTNIVDELAAAKRRVAELEARETARQGSATPTEQPTTGRKKVAATTSP